MANYRGKKPRITWGASFANSIVFGYPLDNADSYSDPAPGSKFGMADSGVEDSWVNADHQFLAADVRWIIMNDAGGVTGWNGSTGWRAFLEWARKKNAFRFYPDIAGFPSTFYTCYIVEPMSGQPSLETDLTRTLRLVIRTTDNTVWDGY